MALTFIIKLFESDFMRLIKTIRQLGRGLMRLINRAVREQRLFERHPGVIFADDVLVVGADRFFPGKDVFIDRRAYLNCAGGSWNENAGFIKIGDNSEIGPYAVLWGAGGITIGNNVHIGAHVSITAHEARQIPAEQTNVRQPLKFEFAPVVIEDNTLICSGAVIVPGVHIGHHVMIGGGSVVTKDIPPYALAVGCPAKVIRFVNEGPDPNSTAGSIGGWDPLNLPSSGGMPQFRT